MAQSSVMTNARCGKSLLANKTFKQAEAALRQADAVRHARLVEPVIEKVTSLLSGEPVAHFDYRPDMKYEAADFQRGAVSTGQAFCFVANSLARHKVTADRITRAVVYDHEHNGLKVRSCIVEYRCATISPPQDAATKETAR